MHFIELRFSSLSVGVILLGVYGIRNTIFRDFWPPSILNVIYGQPLIGSKCHGPQASYFQQPYQVWLRYFKRWWSSGGGKTWIHHSYHQISLAKNMKRKHIYNNVQIIFIITCPFLRYQFTRNMEKVSFWHGLFQAPFLDQGLEGLLSIRCYLSNAV
jgi:hypothetical protein